MWTRPWRRGCRERPASAVMEGSRPALPGQCAAAPAVLSSWHVPGATECTSVCLPSVNAWPVCWGRTVSCARAAGPALSLRLQLSCVPPGIVWGLDARRPRDRTPSVSLPALPDPLLYSFWLSVGRLLNVPRRSKNSAVSPWPGPTRSQHCERCSTSARPRCCVQGSLPSTPPVGSRVAPAQKRPVTSGLRLWGLS